MAAGRWARLWRRGAGVHKTVVVIAVVVCAVMLSASATGARSMSPRAWLAVSVECPEFHGDRVFCF